MEEVLNMIANNGLAVGVAVYFLFKDFRQGQQMVESINACCAVMTEVKEVLAELRAGRAAEVMKE